MPCQTRTLGQFSEIHLDNAAVFYYSRVVNRGRHPLQKTAFTEFTAKGMIPITKNILVVDEEGNEYEATWPKRAGGLVKSGRARFLSKNKICLACPPGIDMEDNEMTDIIMTDIQIEKDTVAAFRTAFAAEAEDNRNSEDSVAEDQRGSTEDTVGAESNTSSESARTASHTEEGGSHTVSGIDMAYIFDQIKAIQNQTDYLLAAIDGLAGMSDGESGDMYAPGNIMGQAKATAFGDVVRCREATNQQLLNFYMTVYNDLKSQA